MAAGPDCTRLKTSHLITSHFHHPLHPPYPSLPQCPSPVLSLLTLIAPSLLSGLPQFRHVCVSRFLRFFICRLLLDVFITWSGSSFTFFPFSPIVPLFPSFTFLPFYYFYYWAIMLCLQDPSLLISQCLSPSLAQALHHDISLSLSLILSLSIHTSLSSVSHPSLQSIWRSTPYDSSSQA